MFRVECYWCGQKIVHRVDDLVGGFREREICSAMVKSADLQVSSYASANGNFSNVKQSARAAGSLPKARTLSKDLSKPVSPAEHEYVLCQQSPSSDISFGWQEVPAHARVASRCSSFESEGVHSSSSFASECTDSYEQINVTTEDMHSNESVEGKEEKSFGITATNKENLREDEEQVAKSTHLALKSDVSENLGSRNFRKNKTRDSVERVSEGHSEELPYPQKMAEDNCKKKKTHDVPVMEDSGSDSSDDSVEVTQGNGTKVLSGLNLSFIQLLDVTFNIC